MRLIDRSRKALGCGLLRRTEGSVAPIFAVSLVPLMIAAGIGVDLSRAMTSRGNLQDALDATALALAHLPSNTSQQVLDQKAAIWLAANLRDTNMTSPLVTVGLTKGQITLDATSTVPTTITGITGNKSMDIAAHSTVKWGLSHVEVALVLDNTGSMAGDKLTRLKTAAKELVDTLEAQVPAGDPNVLKMSVVPFSMTVRLASDTATLNTYKSATWMAGTMPTAYGTDLFNNTDSAAANLTNVNRFTLFTNLNRNWAGCVEARKDPYDVQDTQPVSTTGGTMFVPYFAPDEPDEDTVWKSGSNSKKKYHQSVNSYISDKLNLGEKDTNAWKRRQGGTAKYSNPSSRDESNGKGPNNGCTMQPILRLTTNMTTVRSTLTAMTATGTTNIPIGMMWGWHTLTPNKPFSDGVTYETTTTKKIIVLLTDGDNTNYEEDNPNNSSYTTLGYIGQGRLPGANASTSEGTRTTKMDDRLKKVCDNIKAKGITIYAVRIDVSGTAPTALSTCPTSSEMFYDINSTGLSAAFANIAGSIGKLRIAQ